TSVLALETLDPKKYPPLQFPWKPKYPYVPSAPSQIGQILAAIDKTLSHLEKFDVEKLVNSLDKTLQSADAALQKLGDLDVKRISAEAVDTLASADSAIREGGALAPDARTTLQSMKRGAVGADASRFIDNL